MGGEKINGWIVQSSMPEGFLRLCCVELKDDASGFERIPRSHSRTLVCRFPYNGQVYYYKEYFFPGMSTLMKDVFRGFWNERAARVHAQLEEAGFVVAHVAAIGKKGWRRFMVTKEIVDHDPIRQVFRSAGAEERVGLMTQYGEFVGRLHRCGFSHGDLRWGNILVEETSGIYTFVLIDNERTKLYRQGIPMRLCIKNLVHTRFSGLAEGMTDEVWAIFSNAYYTAFPRAQKSQPVWVRETERKLKQRVKRGEKKTKRLKNEAK